MFQDLRFALRMIRTHRWFSAAVIVTLALGIGINTTVFTLVNAALFKPLPVPDGSRMVTVAGQSPNNPEDHPGVSLPDYRDYKTQNRSFDDMEALTRNDGTVSEADHPAERFRMARITAGLFPLIHAFPVIGHGFTDADCKPGAPGLVLLGHAIWKDRYAGSTDVIGRVVQVNGQPATIVGVMPADFRFPDTVDFWMPFAPDAEWEKRTNRWLEVFAMLKRGVSVPEANRDLSAISGHIVADHPDTNKDMGVIVRTFNETYNGGPIRLIFLTMLGAVGFVLLIACANVANMMLSRAIGRSREIAIRAAIGATRGRIMRQLLVESVLLSVLGGLLGLVLTKFGVHAFDLATRDVGKPYWVLFDMNWVVIGYFGTLCILTGIVFGLMPALRASRVDLNTTMKDGTPGSGQQRGRLAASLVVLQFALTVVLLAGAGLMVRSFFAAQSLNAFVRPESLLTAHLQLAEGKGQRYADPLARRQFFDKLLPELRALPGVTTVATATNFPGEEGSSRGIEIENHPNADPKRPPQASLIVQTPNYFSTIGLPVLLGRGFVEDDGDPGKEASVVSRSFAEKYWPGEPAVGKRFRLIDNGKPGVWMTVIGVSADVAQLRKNNDTPPFVYVTYRQEAWGWMGLVLRTRSDPNVLASALRSTVQKLDRDLPLFEVRTLSAGLKKDSWYLDVFGTLFSVFALSGLVMASVGIYAVVAQATARRTREIGIRMALGATAGNIARLVLTRGLSQLIVGLTLGVFGALVATRVLDRIGLLIGITSHDPAVFAGITVLLVSIGLMACWLPARKAARIQPTEALRTE